MEFPWRSHKGEHRGGFAYIIHREKGGGRYGQKKPQGQKTHGKTRPQGAKAHGEKRAGPPGARTRQSRPLRLRRTSPARPAKTKARGAQTPFAPSAAAGAAGAHCRAVCADGICRQKPAGHGHRGGGGEPLQQRAAARDLRAERGTGPAAAAAKRHGKNPAGPHALAGVGGNPPAPARHRAAHGDKGAARLPRFGRGTAALCGGRRKGPGLP